MQYLEQLLKQFPDTPFNIVVKADVLRRGMAPTPDIAKAGAQSNTTGISSKLETLLGTANPPPSQFHFKADETTVDIKIDPRSPYKILEDEEGAYHLFGGDQNLGEVHFTERPSYMDKQTSNGKPCADPIIQRGPNCICVSPLNFCAYYKKGEACRYCILSAALDIGGRVKLLEPFPDYDIVAEAISIVCEDIELKELKFSGGALYNTRKEAKFHKEMLEAILDRIEPPEEITIFSQALERDDLNDLKALGATNVCFDMEVWDEGLWPELLPGKSKAIGREEWIRRTVDAVEVFGRGHVGSNFVGGFECAPRPGFLSREEALKSYTEGFEYLIERGVVPWFTIWTAYPIGTDFQVDDPPPAEFFLRLGNDLHELFEKHGVYPDLGFPELGVDPPTLGLYCYYCYSMQFTRDYPRLIGRKNMGTP